MSRTLLSPKEPYFRTISKRNFSFPVRTGSGVKFLKYKSLKEREKRHRKQIKEFERIIKKRREEASDSDCVVLSD